MEDILNCNYLFYSVIGPHGKEKVETIITRKQKEIDETGFGLWSARIDKKSKSLVQQLKKTDRVFVLCKINKRATDPTSRKNVVRAEKIYTPEGEKSIPSTINTTYGERDNYQAYVVKKYSILDHTIDFDFEKFESELGQKSKKQPKTVSFIDRFNSSTYFQNTFGRRNNSLCGSCIKPISVIIELEYPFVVDIK